MKMSKKGFTIVELVIVIAVIAILAAVMIPTFSGIVGKAQASVALQEARNEYTAYAGDRTDMDNIGDLLIVVDGEYAIKVVDGQLDAKALEYDDVDTAAYDLTKDLTKYYAKTADEAIVEGKAYFTKAADVYTAVETPALADIATYYEILDLGDADIAIYAAQ